MRGLRFGTYCGRSIFVWLSLLSGFSLLLNLPLSSVLARSSGLEYKVVIAGPIDRTLHTTLEGISDTVALRKEKPPMSQGLLWRRVQGDIPRFLSALKSEGYFGAQLKADIDTSADPIVVTFQVDPGPGYPLKTVDIEVVGEKNGAALEVPEPEDLGLRLGETAKAKAIVDGRKQLLSILKKREFPFPRILRQKVTVVHADTSVAVVYAITPGPRARFGDTQITGLESVREAIVRRKIPWQHGDPYNAELLADLQQRLRATGLFATVRVEPGETLVEGDLLPITVAVNERKHRSVSAGVSYKTDEGLGVKISWEHRNILHEGERLTLSTTTSDYTLAAEGTFRKPEFLRNDQSLLFNLRLAEDRPDAYTSRSFRSSAIVDRNLRKEITVGGGLTFKTSNIDQLGSEESYSLLSVPVHLDWDTRNDALDPTGGARLALQLAPYYDTMETDYAFFKGRFTSSGYLPVAMKSRLVLAGQVAVGAITGGVREAIPADELFYAGGGGSIRGYAFQSVGPLAEGEPLGGRSVLELSAELRLKVTDRLGLVVFLDGGSAFEGNRLDTGEELRWGAGAGLRYFTPVGPIRLDIGVPLNRRPEVDESIQLYVSLGQAF